jgi:hypothetical protein
MGIIAPTHPRRLIRALAIMIVPVLGLTGCIIGLLMTGAMTRGLFARWHPLGAPPDRPTSIVAADYTQIYVVTVHQLLFRYKAENQLQFGEAPAGTWSRAFNPQVEEFSKCDYVAPMAPPPPATAQDFIQFGYCPEPLIDVRYALLTDGSVWRFSTPDGLDVAFTAIPIGVALGLVMGVVLAVAVWRRAGRLSS